MGDRTCSECGQPVEYTGKGQPSKTCGDRCKQDRKNRLERGHWAVRPAKPRPERPVRYRACARCSTTFTVPNGRGRYLYCLNCQSCGVDGCERPRDDGNWCSMHSMRVLRKGEPGAAAKRTQAGWVDRKGYRRFRRPDRTHVFEHHLVMEQVLGRLLLPDENVHHMNGDKLDNRPANLELWNTSQPCGQRIPDKVAWAVELLQLYAPHLLA